MALYIDDRELVAAHQAGDGEAFDELVREHRLSLLAHGRRKLGCEAAAEDALQEVLVRAYRALPRFSGEYKLGPWLHRIMANVCVDEAIKRRREFEKTDKIASEPAARRHAPSVEDELGLGFDDSRVRSALNDLSDPHRQALEMRFVDDLDYEQVAAAAGISEQNARARVSRARSAMRTALRGVAALPVLALGLLKKGEKAAAAATSSGALSLAAKSSSGVTATAAGQLSASPAVAEVISVAAQASPAAVPAIAKAAVGLGLAAAVFAPTSDSAVHQTIKNLSSGTTGLVAESETQLQASTVLTADGNDFTFAANQENAQIEGRGASEFAAIQSEAAIETDPPVVKAAQVQAPIRPESSAGPSTPGSAERLVGVTPSVTPSVEQNLILNSLTVTALSVQEQGAGRYGLSGPASVVKQSQALGAEIDPRSSIWISPEETALGERRFQMEVLAHQSNGSAVTLRVAGYAIGGVNEMSVKGVASITHPLVSEPQIVNLSGRLDLDPNGGSASFVFGS